MTKKISNQLQLEQLYDWYKKNKNFPIVNTENKSIVFGQGNPNARLMIIGEAPGREEDEQGIPFVGRSGRLLTKLLTELGIDRNDIYITNIVKHRPPNNRTPTAKESKLSKELILDKQIAIINPDLIVTLGKVATEALLEQKINMNEQRGTCIALGTHKLVPTYHPAYILRNPKALPLLRGDLAYALSLITTNNKKYK